MSVKNHEISLQQAIELTTRYRNNHPADFPNYETFHIEAISQLISPAACSFLRIYFGRKEDNEVVLILVAADAQEQDLLPAVGNSVVNADQNILIEDGYRCPQYCPSTSVLAGS
ncbi:hypothetical protein FRZ67_19080 [Panacibacter ginsenosidivorans]|uniref:Uncharacterized protein n=1 Tax=Panacibacter ginsenosidivorans TaxID=1813871 RepID=A0A5B8VCP8_9BACT|nr:hypothetical protein [Panacibacter ginsenosidivorans]QEC69307.1 hypothetical protein FRZ67_19080 [Panacibacter ginsenosidivorans]